MKSTIQATKFNENQTIIKGKAIFNSSINKKLIKIQDTKAILQDRIWMLGGRQYQILNWKSIFQNMKECHAERLILSQNTRNSIILQIQNVQFNNLTQLKLSFNLILNVQAMTKIKFQNLLLLYLDNNKISRFSILYKCNFKKLTSLCLFENPVNQIQKLTQFSINPECVDYLWIGQQKQLIQRLPMPNWGRQEKNKNFINFDSSKICKMQTQDTRYFWLNQQKRISQPKIAEMIKNKYPTVFR